MQTNIFFINRTIVSFLIIGVLTVALDALIYFVFLTQLRVGLGWAKALGFLGGALFAFYANRAWTFKPERKAASQLFLFFLVYGFNLLINISANSLVVGWCGNRWIAFFTATLLSASANFAGLKWLVFRTIP